MADKCLVRIEDALTKSGFDKDDAGSILKQIKKAETDSKLKEADDALNAATAKLNASNIFYPLFTTCHPLCNPVTYTCG